MRIAIVKLSAMGDIIHSMVVIQFIKKFNQEISIDWIVDYRFKQLIDCNQDINNIYSVDIKNVKKNKSIFGVFKEIGGLRKLDSYDLVIDMQGLIKSAFISKLIPSKCTLGFDKFSSRESLASIFYNKTFNCPYEINVIERNIKIINFALGFRTKRQEILNKKPLFYSSNKLVNTIVSSTEKNILLIPGASSSAKRYPVEKLAEISKLIDANFLVIWGDLNEKAMANEIKALSPKVKVCEKLSINSVISLISKVDLVIGPDTGPTHLAWALNIPSITLFGLTPGYRNTIQTKINKVIESETFVDPNKIDYKDLSIAEIKVDNIFQLSQKLLQK